MAAKEKGKAKQEKQSKLGSFFKGVIDFGAQNLIDVLVKINAA